MKKFSDGDVYMWIEQDSSIYIKAVTQNFNDPVELTSEEAREIADGLLNLANELDEMGN